MPEQKNGSYKWFVLAMLTMVYAFNFIDRQILVILQEPIKGELGLNDTQLGLLTGLAFAALYVTLGIPIARWADLGNRKNIVAISLAFWSAMTALSGMVTNFFQLFLARIGVGVGEAGGSPPAHSIISDYFPPKQRATALSIYSAGIYFGILLGYLIGGIIAKAYGWRMAFYALGIPGILFAIFIYFTIKEPIKGQSDLSGSVEDNPPLKEVIRTLFQKKTFVFLALATGFHTFGTYGVGNFLPSFMQRVHDIDIATAGIVLGLTTGLGGILGSFLGGFLADKLQERDVRWYLWVPIIAGLLNAIPILILIMAENSTLALGITFITSTLIAVFLGPCIAVTHSLVNAKMRAFASAILFFILNLIGLGFGPLTVGAVSDMMSLEYGNESLKWGFAVTIFTSAISLILFFFASKAYPTELKKRKGRRGIE